jgi:acetolactate synthase-1/2/3 large subunit
VKATDYIARTLADKGVKFVFELTGGMITHLLDSLAREDRIRIVSCHHEQSAAFAAEAVARLTGVPGVALATSGPGATNLLTGIGSCYFDSVPAVFITGQVNTTELRPRQDMRQSGFQEADIVAIASPLTKAAWIVDDAADLPAALERAFAIASAGRRGPVLIDLPMDVQRAELSPPVCVETDEPRSTSEDSPPLAAAAVSKALDMMASATRPLILAGGGVRTADAAELLRSFSSATEIPVVTSLMGLDVLPYGQPQRVGMIGSYGNRWANLALGRSDALLVLGSRLDVRQTGSDVGAFAAGKMIVRVDVDPAELGAWPLDAFMVQCDVGEFLEAALSAVDGSRGGRGLAPWAAEIAGLRAQWPDTDEYGSVDGINPAHFMHELSQASRNACAYVVDVGQNQMWAAQSLELSEEQRFLTSGGMGAMGFALPASIGAALAAGSRPVVAISGDGGAQMNIQELETIARLKLPIKLVVLNNGCLGMVRQFQDDYFDSRHQSTVAGYGAPDFVALAEAFGIAALTMREESQAAGALEWLWADESRPSLLEVRLSQESCVSPKVAFGNPVHRMSPRADQARSRGGTPESPALSPSQ